MTPNFVALIDNEIGDSNRNRPYWRVLAADEGVCARRYEEFLQNRGNRWVASLDELLTQSSARSSFRTALSR